MNIIFCLKEKVKKMLQDGMSACFALCYLLLVFSCSDNGCIDANDFGDYESTSFRVYANPKAEGCEFGDTKDIDGTIRSGDYGSLLKNCIARDGAYTTDANGNTSRVGACVNLTTTSTPLTKEQCVQACINECVQNNSIVNIPWTQVGNVGSISLDKNSEIHVRANGIINLGNVEKSEPMKIDGALLQYPSLIPYGKIEQDVSGNISENKNKDVITSIISSFYSCTGNDSNGKPYLKYSPIAQNYLSSRCLGNTFCNTSSNPSNDALFDAFYDGTASSIFISDNLRSCAIESNVNSISIFNRNHSKLYFARKDSDFVVEFSGDYGISATESNLLKSSDTNKSSFSEVPNVVNGSRRILAYVQKVPEQFRIDPYFPSSPNPLAWNCNYEYSISKYNCSSKDLPVDSYNFYRPANYQLPVVGNVAKNYDVNLSNLFSVDTSSEQSSINEDPDYGSYGFIRYLNDYLKKDEVSLNENYEDDNFYISYNNRGASSDPHDFSFAPKVAKYAYKISLTILNENLAFGISGGYDGKCNDIKVERYQIYKDGVLEYTKNLSPSLPIQNNQWTSEDITLEKDRTIKIKLSAEPNNADNCDKRLSMRFLKYRDVEIAKSGFVRFAILDDNYTSSGSLPKPTVQSDPILNGNRCRIKARIVNPSQTPYISTSSENPHFYEYAKDNGLLDNKDDPYLVYPTSRRNLNFDKIYLKTAHPIFVRKGQIIRFDPVSWDGAMNVKYSSITGTVNSTDTYNQIQCGEGLVMITEPRPAVFCSSIKTDDMMWNQSCIPQKKADGSQGCASYSQDCDKKDNLTTFCPKKCRISNENYEAFKANSFSSKIINAGTSDEKNIKYDDVFPCTSQEYTDSESSLTKCKKCAELSNNAATQTPFVPRSSGNTAYTQCFDLEDYNGSLRSLKLDISSFAKLKNDIDQKNCAFATNPSSSSTPSSSCLPQNIKLLKPFNGYYGNLDNFTSKKILSANNSVKFQTQPFISKVDGLLKFMVIDSALNDQDSFSSITNPLNIAGHNPYSDNSGNLEIAITSGSSFKNGERMEVALCNAGSSTNRTACQTISSNPLDPRIITYLDSNNSASPSYSDPAGNIVSNYEFDDRGNLIRKSDNLSANYECSSMKSGASYFCYTGNSSISNAENARLSFRIKDSERLNCTLSTESSPNVSESCIEPILYDPNAVPAQTKCDGTKVKNIAYDEKISVNTSQFCKYSDSPCKKEYLCIPPAFNNSGFYDVEIKVKKPAITQISGFINKIISPVLNLLDSQEKDDSTTIRDERNGLAQYLYFKLISSFSFKMIFNMAVVLMICFYGLGYFMGLSELKHSDIVNRLLKLGVIYLFTSPTGWYWFNEIFVNFFKDGIEYLTFTMANTFDNSSVVNAAINNQDYTDKSPLFYSVDRVLSLFLSDTVHKKIIALLFHNFFGFIYLLVIYWSAILYVYAISNAVLLYLTAHFFTSLLFGIAPLFFIFLVFEKTKNYFDNWLNALIGFALQRIFLIFTLAMFNFIIYEVVKLTLSYRICWGELWTIDIGASHLSLLSGWEPHSSPSYLRAAMSPESSVNAGSTPSLPMILSLWALCSLMLKFMSYITSLASSLSGGISVVDLGKDISSAMTKGINEFNKYATEGWNRTGGRLVARVDNYLFQSGIFAKQERQKIRRETGEDQQVRQLMTKAANDAVDEYKKDPKNMLKFASMKESERQKEIKNVKEEAMKDRAKKMGKSDKEIEKLMSDSGPKYSGNNLFEAMYATANQGLFSGGSLINSMKDKLEKNDTSYDASHVKGAMKNASAEEREKMSQSFNDGKLDIKKSNIDKFNEIRKESNTLISKTAKLADISLAGGVIGEKISDIKYKSDAANDLASQGKIRKIEGVELPKLGNLAVYAGAHSGKEMKLIREKASEKKLKEVDDSKKISNPKQKDIQRIEAIKNKYNVKDVLKSSQIREDGKIMNRPQDKNSNNVTPEN